MSEGQMIKLDAHTALIVEEGVAAWGRIKRQESWQDWLRIGKAIDAGRTAMMSYLRTNTANGRVWAEHWGAWLKETGLDAIDKGTRSRLQNCIDELPAVEEWRQSVGLTKALTMTHPDNVWKKFQAARKPKVEKEPGEKIKAQDNLTASIERLEQATDRIESEQLMLDLDDPENAAETFIAYYGEEKAKRFADFVSFLLIEKVAPEIAHRAVGVVELTDAQIFHANAHGHDDFADGRYPSDNPYDNADPVRRQAWLDGYESAAKEHDKLCDDAAAAIAQPDAEKILSIFGSTFRVVGENVWVEIQAGRNRRATWRKVSDKRRIAKVLKAARAT